MKITQLYQSAVYAGLIAGLPNKKVNDILVSQMYDDALKYVRVEKKDLKMAQEYLSFPVIIQPERKQMKEHGREFELLPDFFTVVVFSDGISSVMVLMYTEKVGDAGEIWSIINKNNIDLKKEAKEIVW